MAEALALAPVAAPPSAGAGCRAGPCAGRRPAGRAAIDGALCFNRPSASVLGFSPRHGAAALAAPPAPGSSELPDAANGLLGHLADVASAFELANAVGLADAAARPRVRAADVSTAAIAAVRRCASRCR